ncbi:MAG: FHA domain-containing protein, partial [Myxococcota bacterium]
MRLELRDLESETTHAIFESGAILGRERRATDISLRDDSISKRHARIFVEEGRWLIEDLGSSNGTYVRDQRITEPTPLSSGMIFTLAHRRFEVVHLEASGEPAVEGEAPEAEAPAPAPLKGLVASLPKAAVHFATAVPKLLVNPVGSFRDSTVRQRHAALMPTELAAYGMVATTLVSVLVTAVAAASSVFHGQASLGMLLASAPVIGISAAVGAALGLLGHSVVRWTVARLGGDSSDRSRTNFMLDSFAFTLVAVLPQALGTFASFLGPTVGTIVPVLLGIGLALLAVYLVQQWAMAFGLSRGARGVLVGLAVLGLLGSVVQGARQILRRTGPDPALAAIETNARAEAGRAPSDLRGSEKEGTEGASLTTPVSTSTGAEDLAALVEIEPPPMPSGQAAAPTPEPAPEPAPRPPPTTPEPAPRPPPSEPAPTENGEHPALSRKHPRGMTPFRRFVERRSAIERAVADDPALLERRDVLKDYQAMWKKTYEVRERWARLGRRKPAWERDKIYARKSA